MGYPSQTMTLNEYQRHVMRTAATSKQHDIQMCVLGLGIAGEAGECADLVKKIVGHGHPFTDEVKGKLVKEIGDVLWYAAALADHIGVDLETVAELNVEKLKARYPNGFERERSLNRSEG